MDKTNIKVREPKARYRSEISRSIHETVKGFAKAGLVDKQTMRKFDDLCLRPIPELSGDDIRRIREREKMSQAVFALNLNVSTSVVSQWERGKKRPAGAALKLLSVVSSKGISAIS